MTRRVIISIALVVLLGAGGWYFLQPQPAEAPVIENLLPESDWVYSEPDARGIQFQYPQKLGTSYISAEGWPPQVSLTVGDYSCAEQDEVMVGDRAHCIVKTSEGAAGSTYTTYEYITGQGDFLAHVKFALRFPQCMNYDEPKQGACKAEQASFDIDGLVDRIASSIRMN